jgi:hypothetical protein
MVYMGCINGIEILFKKLSRRKSENTVHGKRHLGKTIVQNNILFIITGLPILKKHILCTTTWWYDTP